ncbi:MAG: hypothetical protein DMF63_05475 [Acidobacteria bacterium]|nr:MAG: hypothetical protein DMF63_05475 [Acidobacteriota bacterium]
MRSSPLRSHRSRTAEKVRAEFRPMNDREIRPSAC